MELINVVNNRVDKFLEAIESINDFVVDTSVMYKFFDVNAVSTFSEIGRSDPLSLINEINQKIPKYESGIYTVGIVNVVARTEAFLNDILEVLFMWRKEALISNKSINYKDIITSDSLENLVSSIRSREILEFSHSSFSEKLKYLSRKFSLKLERIDDIMPELIELFTTRNIILHNNGIVNDTYLLINKSSEFNLGDTRVVDKEYFERVRIMVYLVARVIQEDIKKKI